MTDLQEPPRRQRDAAATKARLLEAAVDEFADNGLAGARIDRIADRAGTNKRMIYAYFASKDELFDAALESRMALLTDAVPFTPEDSYRGKLTAIGTAQKAGELDPELPTEDVLAMVIALVASWLDAAPALKQVGRGEALGRRRLAAHRAALVAVVSRAFAPGSGAYVLLSGG